MKKAAIFLFAVSLLSCGLLYAQEADTSPGQEAISAEQDIQWLWGEVVSVDLGKKEILVKYMDYETDNEEEMTVAVDEKTVYENAVSLEDVKPQDTLSIDYIVTSDGKNLARTVGVEKPEAPENMPAGTGPEAPVSAEEME